MGSLIRTDHDPPRRQDLNEDGQDTREHVTIKARPGHPKRRWKRAHREAGYHLQDWHDAQPDHDCLGLYRSPHGFLRVTYLEQGHTGAPEYRIRIRWHGGTYSPALTVLDHECVDEFMHANNAKKV